MSGANLRKVEDVPPTFENLGATELKNLCGRLHKSIVELESTRDIDAKTLTIAKNELYSLGQKLTRVERELRDKAQAETEFDIKYIALNEEKQKAIAAAEAKDEENTQLSRK